MKFIYQIGRYDRNYLSEISFVVDNNIFKAPLSSICLKSSYSNTKLTIVYPVSIVYNKIATELGDEFSKSIVQNIKNYLSNPNEIIKTHPHNQYADDFIVIHSLGNYKFDNVGINFEVSYDDIVLEILCDMIEKYIEVKDQNNEFYVDISSGLNIYIYALIEALKHFSVFSHLLNWQYKNLRPRTYIVFSDPILGSSAEKFQIYVQQVDFKTFFSAPVKNEDVNMNNGNRLSKRIFCKVEDKEKRKNLDELLINFVIVFSAIKNNTPLVLYHFRYNKYDDIITFLKNFIRELKKELIGQGWHKSPNISKNDYLKIILSLGLYAGIVQTLEKNLVKNYDLEEGVNLNVIKEKFGNRDKSIYSIFDLGFLVHHLGQEIYNLSEGKDENGIKEKATNNWEKLNKSLPGNIQDFVERNFFAHTGFERNVTEVRLSKEKNEIYLRYAPETENEIKNIMIQYFS